MPSWCVRKIIGDEPLVVLLGDYKVRYQGLKQLIDQYGEPTHASVGVPNVQKDETNRYGFIEPSGQTGRQYQVENLVEKPALGTLPLESRYHGEIWCSPLKYSDVLKNGGQVLADRFN